MDKVIFSFTVIFLLFLSGIDMISEISAETMTELSSGKSLDIRLELDDDIQPQDETRLKIEFLTPKTDVIQVHIDYTVNIKNNGDLVFGPIPLTHTSTGSVSIPVIFHEGINTVMVDVEGIFFAPIPKESASFEVLVGQQISDQNTMILDNSEKIPAWIKSNADWWSKDLIDDATFVSGIQFLINEEIIAISSTVVDSENTSDTIPAWIKSNADWWSQGLISDDDFLKGIKFLVENGIISVETEKPNPNFFEIGGVDLSQASPILGSDDAMVTIIEFGDYQCPKCKQWFVNTKPELVTNYIDSGIVNLYFVDIAFLGNDSLTASSATYCAEEQGMYWEYHSYLYSNQRRIDSGWANTDSLQTYAEVLGLNTNAFSNCLSSGKYDSSVVFNLEKSIENGIKATPSFIIVGPDDKIDFIEGPQPYAIFESVVESMMNS